MKLYYDDSTQSLSENCVYKDGTAVCALQYAVTGIPTTYETTFTGPVTPFSTANGAIQTQKSSAARIGLSSAGLLGVVGAAMVALY